MGAVEVEAFLSHLAAERNVSASTQNHAKSALLFLYKEVLGVNLPWLAEVTQARVSRRLPVVLIAARSEGAARPSERHDVARGVLALLVHSSVNTTMIYTHMLNKVGRGILSPLDAL